MTASLELCKELFALKPEWDDTDDDYCRDKTKLHKGLDTKEVHLHTPAYDTDYLLDKLPKELWTGEWVTSFLTLVPCASDEYEWEVYYKKTTTTVAYSNKANTPPNALCKLAIELTKNGTL